MADRAKVSGRQDHKVNIITLVLNWLHDEKSGYPLIVFDSLDDIQLMHSKREEVGLDSLDSRTAR